MAEDLVIDLAAERKIRILPIDSDYGAIFQCLQVSDSNPSRS